MLQLFQCCHKQAHTHTHTDMTPPLHKVTVRRNDCTFVHDVTKREIRY